MELEGDFIALSREFGAVQAGSLIASELKALRHDPEFHSMELEGDFIALSREYGAADTPL